MNKNDKNIQRQKGLYFPAMYFAAIFIFYLMGRPVSYGRSGAVLGATTILPNAEASYISETIKIESESSFTTEETIEIEEIPFEVVYQDDSEMEYGVEKILEPGKDGKKTLYYTLTYWGDTLIDKTLARTEIEEPRDQLTAFGTKVVWRELKTEIGKIEYWRKLRVWATKYDGNCVGCRGLTYSGTRVVKGVCAVDPDYIPLGTNFYVEGYGICRSEDIGGGINGYEVDLGFEDASKAAWGAAYTTVYLMTSSPDGTR